MDFALAPAFIDRKSEFSIDKLESELTVLVSLLERIGKAELEVHGVGVGEVFEESEELDDVILLDDLESDACGGPLFVNRDDHAATGDGEGVCETGIVLARCQKEQ